MTDNNSMQIKTDKDTATLNLLKGTMGPDVVDVRKLYADKGVFTYDPGYTSTASCQSKITYIDGEKGELYYRGYPIEQLAEKSNYLETCYLLLNGELPNAQEFATFRNDITYHTMVHEQIKLFYRGFPLNAHPMSMLIGVIGALSAFYPDSNDINNKEQRELASIRIIAKLPTLVAMAYKHSIGHPMIQPQNDLGYAENFLRMCFAVPTEPYRINPTVAKALDTIFLLHADHEQNASTSTVRLAGSSGAHPFACIASGIACLWGPAHGGANEAALNMLKEIGSVNNIPDYIAKVKNKEHRLMGFGHRVYKNYDPRAKIIQRRCHEVLEELGKHNDPLFKVALELEKIALNDEYFINKQLYPNVDFYSGIILSAIGFDSTMFTPLFALGRTVGWISHWKEMLEDKEFKIGRPRQLYLGHAKRDYLDMKKR